MALKELTIIILSYQGNLPYIFILLLIIVDKSHLFTLPDELVRTLLIILVLLKTF